MQARTSYARNVRTGVPAPLAQVRVKLAGTATDASLFSDEDGSTPKANPFTADALTGIYTYYAPNGLYDETVTPVGLDPLSYAYTTPNLQFGDLGEFGVFDVKSFGAQGDGVTDDRAAIQAAIDAAVALLTTHCPIVYFPPGVYRISSGSIVIKNASNPTIGLFNTPRLLGAGMGHTFLVNECAANNPTIKATAGVTPNVRGLEISDMEIRGNENYPNDAISLNDVQYGAFFHDLNLSPYGNGIVFNQTDDASHRWTNLVKVWRVWCWVDNSKLPSGAAQGPGEYASSNGKSAFLFNGPALGTVICADFQDIAWFYGKYCVRSVAGSAINNITVKNLQTAEGTYPANAMVVSIETTSIAKLITVDNIHCEDDVVGFYFHNCRFVELSNILGKDVSPNSQPITFDGGQTAAITIRNTLWPGTLNFTGSASPAAALVIEPTVDIRGTLTLPTSLYAQQPFKGLPRTLANNGTLDITDFTGLVTIQLDTSAVGVFACGVGGGGYVTMLANTPAALFSVTPSDPAKLSVYYSGGKIILENKTGSTYNPIISKV